MANSGVNGEFCNYGYGRGFEYGTGYGYGYGYGSGDGYSYGGTYGCSYNGYGYGYSDGYFDTGDGIVIGEIDEICGVDSCYDVTLLVTFGVVKVGCQVMTIAEWRKQWREVASKEEISVPEAVAHRLLRVAEQLTEEAT